MECCPLYSNAIELKSEGTNQISALSVNTLGGSDMYRKFTIKSGYVIRHA